MLPLGKTQTYSRFRSLSRLCSCDRAARSGPHVGGFPCGHRLLPFRVQSSQFMCQCRPGLWPLGDITFVLFCFSVRNVIFFSIESFRNREQGRIIRESEETPYRLPQRLRSLHPHQQSRGFPSPHPRPHLSVDLLTVAVLTGGRWCCVWFSFASL